MSHMLRPSRASDVGGTPVLRSRRGLTVRGWHIGAALERCGVPLGHGQLPPLAPVAVRVRSVVAAGPSPVAIEVSQPRRTLYDDGRVCALWDELEEQAARPAVEEA